MKFLGKRWFFGGSKVLYPLPHSKWGKAKKIAPGCRYSGSTPDQVRNMFWWYQNDSIPFVERSLSRHWVFWVLGLWGLAGVVLWVYWIILLFLLLCIWHWDGSNHFKPLAQQTQPLRKLISRPCLFFLVSVLIDAGHLFSRIRVLQLGYNNPTSNNFTSALEVLVLKWPLTFVKHCDCALPVKLSNIFYQIYFICLTKYIIPFYQICVIFYQIYSIFYQIYFIFCQIYFISYQIYFIF